MKYLIFNLHDTNVSNFLRFLGYWSKYGYTKHVRFASSVRLEMFIQKIEGKPKEIGDYRLRIVYDDEEIHLPFCIGIYCTIEEYMSYVDKHLLSDLSKAEEFCNSE